MDLAKFDEKHVRVTDRSGSTYTGVADFFPSDYVLHEYGVEEDSILVDGYLVYRSSIASIDEIEVHGTAELRTERLILRRFRPEDYEAPYRYIGSDPLMHRYSGWNPYATPEMAQESVRRFIESYSSEHFYSWVIDVDSVLFGTIGAYDYENGRIEVGFSILQACWGRGYATEALKKVLEYLTENEDIPCVTAWCASENTASRRVLEKAGMKLAGTETSALTVGSRIYDKLIFEYTKNPEHNLYT
ncbi:MAG: GNAT family N-acetyltransferase [Clostridia bacterium]|nr:GNAT family N-acetyltransferase [Clostridia bacterium]